MKTKILGTRCSKIGKLERNAKKALEELGINASIERVTDLKGIMKCGVMQISVLVAGEEVKAIGRFYLLKN